MRDVNLAFRPPFGATPPIGSGSITGGNSSQSKVPSEKSKVQSPKSKVPSGAAPGRRAWRMGGSRLGGSQQPKLSPPDPTALVGADAELDRPCFPGGHTPHDQIPLTPALSPRERENHRQPVGKSCSSQHLKRLPTAPPLPSGEGRGEGNLGPGRSIAKHRVCPSTLDFGLWTFLSRCPLNHHRRFLSLTGFWCAGSIGWAMRC